MAETLASLAIKLSADMANFENDLGRATRLADKRSKQMKRSFVNAFKAITAASAAAGGALATLVKVTANTADNIQKLSQRLGVSTEFLSQMRHTTELTGVQFSSFTTALQRMTRRLSEVANTGKGEAAPALEALGISAKSIKDLAPEQQMLMIADAMKNVSSQGERVRIAMKLFDTEGVALVQTLQNGSQAIIDMNKEADAFGLTISQNAADSAANFNDELTRLKAQLSGAAQSIAMDLLPEVTDLIIEFRQSDFVKNFSDNLVELVRTMTSLADEFIYVAKTAAQLFIFGKIVGVVRALSDAFAIAEIKMLQAGKTATALGVAGKGVMGFLGGLPTVAAIAATSIYQLGSAVAQTREEFDKLWMESEKRAQDASRFGDAAQREFAANAINMASSITGVDEAKDKLYEVERAIREVNRRISNTEEIFRSAGKELDAQARGEIEVAKTQLENLTKAAEILNNTIKGVSIPLNKVPKAIKPVVKSFDEMTDAIEKQHNSIEKLVKDAFIEAGRVLDNYNQILNQFMTPMELLNVQYKEQIKSIGEYLSLNVDNAEAKKEAAELTAKVTKEYLAQKKAIESTLTPYEELIASLDEQIRFSRATEEQMFQMEASRLLEQAGITRSNTLLDEYNAKLSEVAERLKAAAENQGVFGNGINDFADLLRKASSDFETFFETLTKGFKNMGKDSQSFADGMSSILGFGQEVLSKWESTAGQDDAGRVLDTLNQVASTGVLGPVAQAVAQVAGFVNQLTGGSLFGTSFELQSTTRNIDIGASGAVGAVETVETRRRSLFRGTARRRTQSDLDSDTLGAIDQLFDNLQIAIQNSAVAVGGIAGDIVEGSFVEEFDKDGNLVSSIATVLGRTYEESFEEFAQRLTAENILAGIGTVFDEVGSIAEQWRDDAESLLDGAQMLLQASVDINAGQGLFDTLTEVTASIESLVKPGETLAAAYQRVQGSTLLLTDAIDLIGIEFGLARDEFVNLAAGISDAAGGLQQAQELWSSYFNTFYTEQERFDAQLASATANRDELLSGLGLDTDISTEQFRELFESVLPTLSADAVVQWLRAADAIGAVIDLESDLNEQRIQNQADLTRLIDDVSSELDDMDLSDFAKRLKEIRKAFEQQIQTARELGATERELAMIQTHATRQINQAIQALESDIGNALNDLYGSELDRINEQISLLESQESNISRVSQANDNLYESQLRAIQGIRGFLDDILLNEQLSPLNPQEQLAEAQNQFNDLLAAAQGGDVDALNALPQLAQTLLGFGQQVYASSQDYVDIFDSVTAALATLGVTASEPTADPQNVIIGQNQQMIELMSRRNEIENEGRLQAAQEIAEQIRELTSVTGESFTALAERLGIPVEQFLNDLGVSLDTLTVETATALAETAARLGVEVADLAESVGISLGDLADDQSLLNDALEATIRRLPSGIAQDLDSMLTAIERSTDPAAREELLEDMVEFISTLPADQQELLAPYFEQIDPITEAQQQVSLMEGLNATSVLIREELAALRGESNENLNNIEQINSGIVRELNELNRNLSTVIQIAGVA